MITVVHSSSDQFILYDYPEDIAFPTAQGMRGQFL